MTFLATASGLMMERCVRLPFDFLCCCDSFVHRTKPSILTGGVTGVALSARLRHAEGHHRPGRRLSPGGAVKGCPYRCNPPRSSSDRAGLRLPAGDLRLPHCCHGPDLDHHHGAASDHGGRQGCRLGNVAARTITRGPPRPRLRDLPLRAPPATFRTPSPTRGGQRPRPAPRRGYPLRREFQPGAAETARKHHGAIANADQAADRMTHRFQHATHFSVAAFGDGDRYQQFDPSPPPSSMEPKDAMPSSGAHRPAAFVFPHCSKHPAPERRTHAPARSGVHQLVGQLPELVNSRRPSVFRSRRPTDCHLPCMSRGSLRNTVGRF